MMPVRISGWLADAAIASSHGVDHPAEASAPLATLRYHITPPASARATTCGTPRRRR